MAVVKKTIEVSPPIPNVQTPKQEAIREKTLEELEAEKRDRNARSIEYQRKIDSKLVEGIFRYYEVPGGEMHFPYRAYKGDKMVKYSLKDNGTYKIPLGVAKHLNNNCWYPVHRHEVNVKGKARTTIGSRVNRTGFQSLEFMENDSLSNEKVTEVQVVG